MIVKKRFAMFAAFAAAVCLFSAGKALACSRVGAFSFEELLAADAIVRATAVHYVGEPDLSITTTGVPAAKVKFDVEEVLFGKDVDKTIVLNGYLSDKDDFNDQKVPYTFVRKSGRSGSCFANTYKKGGQFLLFLKKVDSGYTTNISALGPANEQITGSDDPWLLWVRRKINRRQYQ